jgi:uracil-DNA glycosylase
MRDDNLQRLDAMGIQTWQLRQTEQQPGKTAATETVVTSKDKPRKLLSLNELQSHVAACTTCDLHKARKNTVFGVGNANADLLIVGEAPGASEDAQGEPFVGRAGQLLNLMLNAIDLNREDVFIANILKCRPPQNRDPSAEEIRQCKNYLHQQIAFIKPKLILAVGRIAAQDLLGCKESLSRLRGSVHHYNDTPLLITYHPAYLLRSPSEKRKAFVDLLKVKALIDAQ